MKVRVEHYLDYLVNKYLLLKMDSKNKVIKCKVGFIGGGNMAKAICEGIVKKGSETGDCFVF